MGLHAYGTPTAQRYCRGQHEFIVTTCYGVRVLSRDDMPDLLYALSPAPLDDQIDQLDALLATYTATGASSTA